MAGGLLDQRSKWLLCLALSPEEPLLASSGLEDYDLLLFLNNLRYYSITHILQKAPVLTIPQMIRFEHSFLV